MALFIMFNWFKAKAKIPEQIQDICFIGTSHLRALGNVWMNKLAKNYPHYQADFFSAPIGAWLQAEFTPKQIYAPETSHLATIVSGFAEGKTLLKLDNYDYFVFQAFTFPRHVILAMLKQMQHKPKQFFSGSALQAGFDLYFRLSPEKTYLEHIRRYSEAPIIVSFAPRISLLALEHLPDDYDNYAEQAELLETLFFDAGRRFLARYSNITVLMQPEETVAQAGFTKPQYCREYGQLPRHKITDYAHQNAAYGELVLKSIFETLAADAVKP